MSSLPILGARRSRVFFFKLDLSSFSWTASRILVMPVALMKSGSSNGGFSVPRFPCRYLRFCSQWRGTGTEFFTVLRCTRKSGSAEFTSCISTRSGRPTTCFSCATCSCFLRLRSFLVSFFSPPPSPSASSAAPSAFALPFSFFLCLHGRGRLGLASAVCARRGQLLGLCKVREHAGKLGKFSRQLLQIPGGDILHHHAVVRLLFDGLHHLQ
mmetsp:Transcript_32305/g.80990  ORF Transcript_32305/g.80990 Transcript_32305/m.80990 type:complete len:212 (-) Transcript_32305:36-671(-)